MIVGGGWVVEWKGDDDGGVWVCGCVAWVWEVRMRGASPRSGAFWCERSGREERREEPGRLVHAWCGLLRIIYTPPLFILYSYSCIYTFTFAYITLTLTLGHGHGMGLVGGPHFYFYTVYL